MMQLADSSEKIARAYDLFGARRDKKNRRFVLSIIEELR